MTDLVQVLIAILLIQFAITSTCLNSTFFTEVRCSNSNGNYTPNSLYQYNLYNLLGTLTSKSSTSGFHKASYGNNPYQAFAFYLCRGDLENQDCSICVNAAKDYVLKKCPFQTEALIYYNECKLRFSNKSFFGKMDLSPKVIKYNPQNRTGNLTWFKHVMVDTLSSLEVEAARKKFATKVVNMSGLQGLYAVAQCSPDLIDSDCERCLGFGIAELPISTGARVLLPSCCVRYESYLFGVRANLWISQRRNRKHSLLKAILMAISISIGITFLLGCGIWIFIRRKKAMETSKFEISEIRTMESLEFDLHTIRAATHNFSVDSKLGEGGFGEVYKGMLKDGQEVAIKRLSKNSGQGIEEFKTEVVLVAKLQHKNLVKLLGFCLASKEKILVYEFLRNSSLDNYLFVADMEKKLSLNWEVRFKLIVGIARGLLYLHEDSRLTIIHRDLKPSNILLDENMNPKISDFGLAKLFTVDQTQGDTKRIVGTYGYMAPEYAMTGHFSMKSDVYSFGIIVLEIVSGQKNRFFDPIREETLLHRAWRLWNEGKGLDLVDMTLDNKFPREEVTKCIHIGLLCIQESAIERPIIATVVAALNGQSISLPMPKPPNFLGNTGTTTGMCSPYYKYSLMGENEIEYCHQLYQQGYVDMYTGTEKITNVYPR